jgi:histidine triad (HIT) family protein
MNCIFCKIVSGEAPAAIVYRDEQTTAFRDLHPVAPTHILVVPNKHIESVNDITPEDEIVLGHLFFVAKQIAKQEGIAADGYRLIVNTGANAGQVVFHLHLHILGGGRLRHPMG